jgi:hypothetical protein
MEKEKPKNSAHNRYSRRLFFAWLGVCIVWLIGSFSRLESNCPPSYRGSYDELVSYSEVLSRHSMNFFSVTHPIFIFIVFNLVAVILLVRTKRWLLVLLLIPLEVFAGLGIFVSFFCGDGTDISHRATIDFDGSRYHLAAADDVASGMDVVSRWLMLFECNSQRDECRGRIVADSYSGNLDSPQLDLVDQQLRVLADGEIVFRLDKKNLELATMPSETLPISIDTIDRIENVAEIHYDSPYYLEWLSNEELIVSGMDAIWYHQLNPDSISTSSVPRGKRVILSFNPRSNQLAVQEGFNDDITVRDMGMSQELMAFPNNHVTGADFSSNGELLATTNNGQAAIYDADDYRELAQFETDDDVFGILLSPDNRLLLAWAGNYADADYKAFVHIWNIETQEEVFVYQIQTDTGYIGSHTISFSPDSRLITIPSLKRLETNTYPAEFEQTLHVLDYEAGTELLTLSIAPDWGSIMAVNWSQDGRLIMVGTEAKLSFWDSLTGDLLKQGEISDGMSWLSPLALSPDGRMLALGINGGVQFWAVPATEE